MVPAQAGSEAEVAEGLVGLGHAVDFVALFHGTATAFVGLQQLVGQALRHGLLAALAGGFLDPAHGQGQAANRAHFDRHLVVGATHTAGLHFHHGLDVVDGREEQLQRILAALLFHLLERAVDDALGNSLLAAFHDHIHELGQLDIAELGIRQDFTFRDFATTWHVSPLASVDDRNVLFSGHPADPSGICTYSTHQRVTTPDRLVKTGRHRIVQENRSGLLGALGAILGTGLLAILDALQVQRATHDVVTHTGQILDTTATDQHDAVFLEVVAFTADVGNDFETVGQAHLGDLTQSGVRLLGRRGVHTGAHTAALRAVFHGRALGFGLFDLPAVAHELVDGWH